MEYLIVICGALGAWLLVAGPIYQAVIELKEEAFDREGFEDATSAIPRPDRLSAWWWLLPPVAYFKQRARSNEYRRAVMDLLAPEQREQMFNFMNKASGWLLVALGAFLIAFKETWELCELFHLPLWTFIVLVAVAALLSVGYASFRENRTQKILKKDVAEAEQRRTRHGS
ncbi:hypothetical protein BH09ACT1_BH09ACT1_27900 [soil metagenome]